jgi:transposase
MDNAAIHRFEGGRVLAEWLDSFGVTVIYLPVYSPELNPVELLFNKFKTVLRRYEFRNILQFNIHVGVYRALQEITVSDLRGFYNHVQYLQRV